MGVLLSAPPRVRVPVQTPDVFASYQRPRLRGLTRPLGVARHTVSRWSKQKPLLCPVKHNAAFACEHTGARVGREVVVGALERRAGLGLGGAGLADATGS